MEPKHYNPHSLSCIFLVLVLVLLLNPFSISAHNQHDTRTLSQPWNGFLENFIGARKGNSSKGLSHLKNYLSSIGYMQAGGYGNNEQTHHETEDLFDDALEQAITNYQTYFKLPVNGFLDASTVENLSQPRCGVSDKGMRFKGSKNKSIGASHYSFFPGAPKWPPGKRSLTYSFPPGERTDVNSSTLEATNKWAGVSPFKFSYTSDYNHADIKISFVRRDHGDGSPFDGPGNVLAHAFSPPDGRLHYDGDEAWVYGIVKDEFDILTVGLHELGHVLGLGHSDDKYSIMYPYIGSGIRKNIGEDDIAGIRALYFNEKPKQSYN